MTEFPQTTELEYKLALQYECVYCNAKIDERCQSSAFPKYPHTDRMKTALMAEGWPAKKVNARYNF